jgi:hypothetical protein
VGDCCQYIVWTLEDIALLKLGGIAPALGLGALGLDVVGV